MKKLTFLILFNMLAVLAGFSQNLESGKVYRFKNVGKPGNNLSLSSATQGAVGAAASDADLKQQWYLTSNSAGTAFYFRNASTGAYLASPKATYTQWPVSFTETPDESTMALAVTPYEGNYVIKALSHNNSYAYAHNDGSNNIVCWLASSTPTQWTFEEVPMTQAQIEAMLARFKQTGDEIAKAPEYERNLAALFSDKACTNLTATGDLTSNSNYQALPATLKDMVDKAQSGDWKESAGDWDSEHAKKYRIQLYEPYSEGSAAAGMVGIQAYTNMNNPTGIIANSGDMLYVMVDKEVPEGATLYIGGVPDCSMYNSVTAGTKLHQGLNMILCNSDLTHYFIYYTVNTVSGGKPVRSLKGFEPITIHIEGGEINGFFNSKGDALYKADTKADFEYTTQRAKHPMYDLIGQYVILHFYLQDTPDVPGGTPQICVKNAFNMNKNPNAKHDDPVITMEAWDKMCFAERILMGIQSAEDVDNPVNEGMYQSIIKDGHEVNGYIAYPEVDYSEYFNNRMMGINYQAAGLYMNATSWRTAYAASTIGAILSQFPEDGIWGPAHEYGHMNQGPIAIAGTTEESNNVFSNVANYFVCRTTARCDYPSEQLKHFSNGDTYLENSTWGTTRMFWQLWCYYHAAGNNKKFYPRLFELLRRYPLKRETTTYPGKLNGKADMLQFVKMACIAAEEDLTNFFASWGFFSPQDTYHIDDYSIYDMILTPEDIAEVKAEIKSWNFKKNDAIILIDDRVNSKLNTGFGYNKDLCGQYGGIDSFKEGAAGATGNFEFTVDGNKVSVSGGNPGAGFLIFDEDGNLIGFSNSNNFTLSNEAAEALVNGKATVKAVAGDNSEVKAIDPVRDGSPDRKKELLKTLLDRCDLLLGEADETMTHIGKLIPASCSDLKSLRDEVYAVWQNSSDGDKLTEEYLNLSAAYYALLNDKTARIPLEEGASYRLVNHNYTSRALDAGADKLVSTTFNASNPGVPFSQQWVFEPADATGSGAFYLRNMGDGRYIGTTKKQSADVPLGSVPQSYQMISIEPDVFSFAPDNEVKFGLHIDASNKVVQWNTTSTSTQWTLVKVMTGEQIALRNKLNDQLAAAEQLLATSGTMERTEPKEIVFGESNVYTNAPYTSANNGDTFRSWNVIFDKDISTYFHSNYDNNKDSEDGLDHYIRLEAPDGGTFRFFDLNYITRHNTNTNTNPKSVVIEASADKKDWREIYHATGLKTGDAVSNESGEIYAPEGTKYIRFMVTGATALAKGHPYFCLSELSVNDLGEPVFTPDAGFPYLKAEDMQALYDEIIDARLDLAYSATSAQELSGRLQQMAKAADNIGSVMIPEVDVTALNFAVNPVVVKLGDKPLTITATVEPEDATFPQFVWSIADESIAMFESTDGKSAVIKPLANGMTDITLGVAGNPLVTATAVLKVLPEIPVEGVSITPSEITVPMNVGEFSLTATVYPAEATKPAVIWASSDPSVLEIDPQTGIISVQRQGYAEITATTTDFTELSAKCFVTVSNPVAEGLIVYPSTLTLEAGEEVQLNALYIPQGAEQPMMVWTSDAEAIATVDPSGLVKAIAEGTTQITVSAEVNGHTLSASAEVKVNPASLKAISISPLTMELEQGATSEIKLSLSPSDADADDLSWYISDSNVAGLQVNSDKLSAKVSGLKAGMALVTVSSVTNPDISASCQITVPEKTVTAIQLVEIDPILDIKDGPKTLKVKIMPEDAPIPHLVWTSSSEKAATVESAGPTQGLVTPKANGETTITVSHSDKPEIFDSIDLTVTGASGIAALFEDADSTVNVYDLSGHIIRKNVTLHSLEDLAPGIYIIRQGDVTKEVYVR